jgi:hypothetical protein
VNNNPETSKVSLFTIPKAFQGLTGIIQRNALRSWTELRPTCEIILFGNEKGTQELTEELELRLVPELKGNDAGTPLVNDLFLRAEEIASNQILGYVNADIIFPKSFLRPVERVSERFERFLIVGRAVDLDVTRPLEFSTDWELDIHNLICSQGRLRPPWGSDYFVFSRGLWANIPAFAIGRTSWDNWLIYEAIKQGAAVIDATSIIQAVHQNHDYGQYVTWAGKRKSEEAAQNRMLYLDSIGNEYWFSVKDVTHKLNESGIRSTYWTRMRYPIWKISRTPPIYQLMTPALKLQYLIQNRHSVQEEPKQ